MRKSPAGPFRHLGWFPVYPPDSICSVPHAEYQVAAHADPLPTVRHQGLRLFPPFEMDTVRAPPMRVTTGNNQAVIAVPIETIDLPCTIGQSPKDASFQVNNRDLKIRITALD